MLRESHPFCCADHSNPGRVLLPNVTAASSGLYRCTAGNEAGQESCVVRVTVQCRYRRGLVSSALCFKCGNMWNMFHRE